MSPHPHLHRLAYDDAVTPHEMYDDCRAAGQNLKVPTRRSTATATELGFDDYMTPVKPTIPTVSEKTASMAAGLHLHLN